MALQFSRAIVVGASSGIGEALARTLAADGAEVALLGRRAAELERVAAGLSGRGRVYVHDVVNTDEVPGLFERIVADLEGVDCVVYASGVMPEVTEGEYSFAKDRQMVEVNLLGAMAWLNVAAARFEAARSGTIIGISSIAGERGRRVNPAYGTTKAAFSTYLEALRNRTARYGVNVVTIKPGYVDTAMIQGKKVFWVVSPERAADLSLRAARRGSGASVFVPARWGVLAFIMRLLPSFIFRRMNF